MRSILVITAVLLMFGPGAHATVLVPADLGELSREAYTIARGRVVAVDAQWTDSRRSIETLVTLDVESYLKGRLGETLRFRVPGGMLGRFRNIVVGAPEFVAGQRVIVFLGTRGPMVPYVLGLNQGVFRVGQDAAGNIIVTPPPVVTSAAGPVVRGSRVRRPARLATFERDVRTLAAGGLQ